MSNLMFVFLVFCGCFIAMIAALAIMFVYDSIYDSIQEKKLMNSDYDEWF